MSSFALVTGGGTGIGAAIARRLTSDVYGVCITGRRREPLVAVCASELIPARGLGIEDTDAFQALRGLADEPVLVEREPVPLGQRVRIEVVGEGAHSPGR